MATSHRTPLLLALALALALLPLARPAQAAGLTVVSDTALSERLHEIVVFSPAMERETALRVLLPTGYDPAADRDYPTLYLLHGCCDTYRSWSDKTDLEAFTADLDVVVVMPDAGQAGFYSDWYRHGPGGPPRWETLPHRRAHPVGRATPTTSARARSGRALAGLSMGGFGSFSYAGAPPRPLRVGGGVLRRGGHQLPPTRCGPGPGDPRRRAARRRSGARARREEVRWRGHNPWDLAENLATLDLWLHHGRRHERDGHRHRPGRVRRARDERSASTAGSSELGVAHEWEDYGAGGHTWDLWQRDLHFTLPQQLTLAEAARRRPRRVHPHRDRADLRRLRLGRLDRRRSVLEFSRLTVSGPGGFAVEGAGTAYVTTAPLYAPGSPHTATVDGAATPVVADRRRPPRRSCSTWARRTPRSSSRPPADALAQPVGHVEVTIA